jgi:HPt (histidine-containing phosphotransfer) domain-containing protein
MNGFLVKPIPLEALRSAIAEVPLPASEHLQSDDIPCVADNATSDLPDWGRLAELLGGNLALAREVVDLLRFEAPRLVRALSDSCALGEAREARRAAHTLKSNLRNLGLNEVAALAGQIECLAQASDWDALPAKVAQLESSVHGVVRWCDDMLAL